MINKKNSRRIKMHGTWFRYKVSETAHADRPTDLNITIQSEKHNGSKLVVRGLITMSSCPDDLDFDWEKIPVLGRYPTITREHVRQLLTLGLDFGWDFRHRGDNFVITATNDFFRYPPQGIKLPLLA